MVPPVAPPVDVAVNIASTSYFAAAGAQVVSGALFPSEPVPGSCDSAVITREAADAYLPNGATGGAVIDAAGRRSEIAGVVDAGPLRVTQRRPMPAIYHPVYLRFVPRMTLIAGTADASASLIEEVDRRLRGVADGAPVRPVMSLEEYLSRTSLGPERVATALVTVSTAIALALAMVGVYAVMADAVREKKREIALRLALGAQAHRIVAEVLRGGLRVAGAGAIAGTALSWLATMALARAAPGFVAPVFWIWLACPLALVAIVTLAGILPARYALAIDPLTLTREE
jgi:putative ABC transport system permease protein